MLPLERGRGHACQVTKVRCGEGAALPGAAAGACGRCRFGCRTSVRQDFARRRIDSRGHWPKARMNPRTGPSSMSCPIVGTSEAGRNLDHSRRPRGCGNAASRRDRSVRLVRCHEVGHGVCLHDRSDRSTTGSPARETDGLERPRKCLHPDGRQAHDRAEGKARPSAGPPRSSRHGAAGARRAGLPGPRRRADGLGHQAPDLTRAACWTTLAPDSRGAAAPD
jgi:hypothetical protein